jgi:hypothetical protein
MGALYAAIRVLLLYLYTHGIEEEKATLLKIAGKSDDKKLRAYSFAERSARKEAVGQLIVDLGSYFSM